ncbi:MAG: DUF3570 domain-containing protein [Deltaproteobacteria bacterium]|nr:DUF3570 domain-containing protein [Deltaproteobacteria bacterium]
MRMQLSGWFSLLLAAGLFSRPEAAQAQSHTKIKHLRYDEGAVGVLVDADDIEVVVDLESGDKFSFNGVHDVITGASPNGIPTASGLTGASPSQAGAGQIGRGQFFSHTKDRRVAVTGNYTYQYSREMALIFGGNFSTESDYLSTGFNVGTTLELNKKNTTLGISFRFNDDTVTPANGGTAPAIPVSAKKQVQEFNVSLTQLISPTALGTLGFFVGQASGYLNDPYKKVLVGAATELNDIRPDMRNNYGVTLDLKSLVLEDHSVLFNYRFYSDDWGIHSNTMKIGMRHDLSEDWLLTWYLRNYTQTSATFWAAQFPSPAPTYHSADIRLSNFAADTVSVSGRYRWSEDLFVEMMLSKYLQYVPGEEPTPFVPVFSMDNQAILRAYVVSLGVEYRF